MKISLPDTKKALSIWVFTITMVVSIFSFYSDSGNYSTVRERVTKKELIRLPFKTSKRSIPYQSNSQLLQKEVNFIPLVSWNELSFKCIIRIRLAYNGETFHFRTHPTKFFLRKTPPQDSDEDVISPLRG